MPNAMFPEWDGSSESRPDMVDHVAPDGFDYEQLVAEILAIQTEFLSRVATMTAVATSAASDVCEVAITAKDLAGNILAGAHIFDLWLSDSADGADLTATTASGTVTAKSASGIVLGTYTAKKSLRVQSLATGVFTLEITDEAKTAFKVCVQVPGTGLTLVVVTLATGDYGA